MPHPVPAPRATHDATRAHLLALARADGYYELRCLRRAADDSTTAGPSCWLAVQGGRPGNLAEVLAWAARHDAARWEVFVAPNPRAGPQGKQKADVQTVSACYADLDLHGQRLDEAQAALLAATCPPSLIVGSGYGLHPLWLLEPSADKVAWRGVQRALATAFAAFAPDPAVVGDEARILRLAPFPNRKHGRVVPTALLHESARTYTLAALAVALAAPRPERSSVPQAPAADRPPGVSRGLWRIATEGRPAGERNNMAFWLACRLVEAGVAAAVGAAVLARYGAACRPPLGADELQEVRANAIRQVEADRRAAQAAPPAGGNSPQPPSPIP